MNPLNPPGPVVILHQSALARMSILEICALAERLNMQLSTRRTKNNRRNFIVLEPKP